MKFLYIWIIGSQEEELYMSIFMCKLYSPCLKDAAYEIPLHVKKKYNTLPNMQIIFYLYR